MTEEARPENIKENNLNLKTKMEAKVMETDTNGPKGGSTSQLPLCPDEQNNNSVSTSSSCLTLTSAMTQKT